MANSTSQHILGTAANLLGFCLFVITSLHITDRAEGSKIDEFTSIISLLLICSCITSFISIRTTKPKRELRLETVAEYLFMAALAGIGIVILLITLNFMR